jgi:hypothetical protein
MKIDRGRDEDRVAKVTSVPSVEMTADPDDRSGLVDTYLDGL